MSLEIPFDNAYARLPDQFYTKIAPTPVRDPKLFAFNTELAHELGLNATDLQSDDGVGFLAGNDLPEGADPLAQVYAGHQFGGWSPRLGDGRAILLGEVRDRNGTQFDLQLKGSGPTPYSRMGDGRAWLGPVIREYLMSEAMHALGLPTTRALAAVTTGEVVLREGPLPGAILTRVAKSHIRVGTFQYFAAQKDKEALVALVDFALERHDPSKDGALGLLDGVVERQAQLVAKWMGIGFVHGVMNTDNMTISGETIDYGPCAFIDTFHPMRVFSSIDQHGRYAFSRQPDVAMWNLAQLATSLLPLIDKVENAQASIDRFPGIFQRAWLDVYRQKIGLETAQDDDGDLINDLLTRMTNGHADFTNTFRALGTDSARDAFLDPNLFDEWDAKWRARMAKEGATPENRLERLHQTNPAVIARTHRIEEAIQAAVAGDRKQFETLQKALKTPFEHPFNAPELTHAPTDEEVVPQTFCGT